MAKGRFPLGKISIGSDQTALFPSCIIHTAGLKKVENTSTFCHRITGSNWNRKSPFKAACFRTNWFSFVKYFLIYFFESGTSSSGSSASGSYDTATLPDTSLISIGTSSIWIRIEPTRTVQVNLIRLWLVHDAAAYDHLKTFKLEFSDGSQVEVCKIRMS